MRNTYKLMSSLAAALGLLSAGVAHADLVIYVGYADNLRPSGFFPSPWLGGANVVSQSSAAQSFDSGAVRIDNTGASAITISNFEVKLNSGGVVFNFWSALTIGAGKTGIFTQTASYNFDSSDYGPLGGAPAIDAAHPLGGCTNMAALSAVQQADCLASIPNVSFSTDGGATTQSFDDKGYIINTFGYDFINGSSDGNESINWNLIGRDAVRGGTNLPEPATLSLVGLALCGGVLAARRRGGSPR
ncbi:PEP-CTERM sorting domain-containing protein [Roseateles sp.]|uniref:PEP-CTERM sorting domain-containing protein n=1 Tax=Roseateles sp. TaxID=1971397 RepID=UPI0025F1130A|nr:PEP-CTERM sorting domain-containing protein [Roseateles sp.]MBV8035591.1 PEP-CTERM sorting domain-containing protein [Roseateles sp.]